jgi:hypothetical protein
MSCLRRSEYIWIMEGRGNDITTYVTAIRRTELCRRLDLNLYSKSNVDALFIQFH